MLKAFAEANNEELAEERRQQKATRKRLGPRVKLPELVQDQKYEFPEIIFCNTIRQMVEASERIKKDYNVKFDLLSNYIQRF